MVGCVWNGRGGRTTGDLAELGDQFTGILAGFFDVQHDPWRDRSLFLRSVYSGGGRLDGHESEAWLRS